MYVPPADLFLRQADREWLGANLPGLRCDREAGVITGELELRAACDSEQGKLRIRHDDATAGMDSYLCDLFSIRIDLDALDRNGWPAVYEVGDRHALIADTEQVDTIDLHSYPDGYCCLGLQSSTDRRTPLKEFIEEVVVPLFYRLSCTEVHGLESARRHLRGEYSHGDTGLRE